MLILTRRTDQRVFINDKKFVIKVLKIQKGQVYLGFEAPKEINIVREEVYNRSKDLTAKDSTDI